jgi:hypothetical protein
MKFPMEVLPARNRRLALIKETIRTTRQFLMESKKTHPGDWEMQFAVEFVIEEGLVRAARKSAEVFAPIANVEARNEAEKFVEELSAK